MSSQTVTPFSNNLSDHDTQILIINIPIQIHPNKSTLVRRIDNHAISDFIYYLSNETWENVFNATDVDLMFNSFLNTYLRMFYSCFPLIQKKTKLNNNNWITLGIRTSCKRKRELFLHITNSENVALKQYYNVHGIHNRLDTRLVNHPVVLLRHNCNVLLAKGRMRCFIATNL
jgi:hypothetical protein